MQIYVKITIKDENRIVSECIIVLFRGEAAPRNRSGFDASRDSDDIVGAFQDHWVYGDKGDNQTLPDANRHEEEDGTIIAVAATGNRLLRKIPIKI